MSFSGYTHIEEYVEAVQLTPETQETVVKAFNEPASRLEFSKLNIVYNVQEACYEFVFRYKEDSVDSTLKVGDYLVRLNQGNYTAMTEADFKAQYIHTAVDPIIPAADIRTAKGAVVEFIQAYFPSAGIKSEEDLTEENLRAVSNGLLSWYDAPTNTFHVKFNDCGMVSFQGFADLLKAFPAANFMKDDTVFVLEFPNGNYDPTSIHKTPNMFNLIALEGLIGELKKLSPEILRRVVGIDFLSYKDGTPSAVAPSVTDEQFYDWSLKVCGLCPSMGTVGKIRR